jgi:glucokinase
MKVLAGDIGGTHARLALVELDGSARVLAEQTTPTRDAGSLVALVERFLAAQGERPNHAAFGIAGPVVDNEVTGTNIPWQLNAKELSESLGIPQLRLINDFQAVGHGLALLAPRDLWTLQAGHADPEGVIALIGAGTGLGEGFVVRAGDGYSVQASEGGHSSYAPEDPRGWALFNYLTERYGHVSWERVVSGPGIVDCFEFVAAGRESAQQAPLREQMAREDPAAVITRFALGGVDPLALEALELFVDAYGAQAGNLALTVLATGGVYLAGGIARQIAPQLAQGPFVAAFRRKGRMSDLLERIPVQVILNPDVGLLGAAAAAMR